MTSFGYRFTPRYAIKECSSCGTLYTRDCGCSKGNVEDKMLVPKPPKNCARCTRCGYLVDGPNCQGCALLRQKLEENLVTHSPDVQNTSESSNASTNIVNAPREPYVVKQDNGSFVDKIIFDLNRSPDSPYLHTISLNQFRCFHCKDVLRDGEACKRCTCAKYGSGLGKGLCYICGHNQNSLNDSPRVVLGDRYGLRLNGSCTQQNRKSGNEEVIQVGNKNQWGCELLKRHAVSFKGNGEVQKKVNALRELRLLLSRSEFPFVEIALKRGVIPLLGQCLKFGSEDEQLLEAAWCLTNIAAGKPEETRALLPTLPLLIAHLGETIKASFYMYVLEVII
nr:importin subunit alpha-9 [Tanacetum cinerariifolium]